MDVAGIRIHGITQDHSAMIRSFYDCHLSECSIRWHNREEFEGPTDGCHVPSALPPITQYQKAASKYDKTSQLYLLEIFHWLGSLVPMLNRGVGH
jgi:hypothetical protein